MRQNLTKRYKALFREAANSDLGLDGASEAIGQLDRLLSRMSPKSIERIDEWEEAFWDQQKPELETTTELVQAIQELKEANGDV